MRDGKHITAVGQVKIYTLGERFGMNKKRLTLLALMMTVLMILTTGMLFACNNEEPTPEEEQEETVTIDPTEGLAISNSDFKVISTASETYPRPITDWTGAMMYSSGSYPVGVIAGAISLEEALYTANRANWKDNGSVLYDKIKSHYSSEEGAVNNALMIYMPKKSQIEDADEDDFGPTAYGYTSASFSLEASKYYKLSIDVLTNDIAGILDDKGIQKTEAKPGARIYVSTNTYAEFAAIDTKGEWKTYTVYFESAAAASTALNVQLGLGKFSSAFTSDETGLTTGYAFFDNVDLVEVEKGVYTQARNNEANDSSSSDDDAFRAVNQTVTMLTPNGRFDHAANDVSSSGKPANWTLTIGNSGKTDAAPSSTTNRNGVIDVSKFNDNYKTYSHTFVQNLSGTKTYVSPYTRLDAANVASVISNFGDNRVGTNVYMMSQQLMTAQGLSSSKSIVIEKGKNYAVSVDVYTFDVHGAGVTLILSGEGKDISIKGISENKSNDQPVTGLYAEGGLSNGGWETYTFYIQGNQYYNTSYNMAFWLGTGGTSGNNAISYTSYTSTSSGGTNSTTYQANGTFSTGWVFFDEVNLEELSNNEFANAGGGATAVEMKNADKDGVSAFATEKFVKVSLYTDNIFLNSTSISADFASGANADAYDTGTLGVPAGFSVSVDQDDKNLPFISPDFLKAGIVDLTDDETAKANLTALGVDYPGLPYEVLTKKALMINSDKDSFYEFETDLFTIASGSFYRISMWIYTADIRSSSGLNVYLYDDEDAEKSSFTLINTTDHTDEDKPSEWREYTFYLRGANEEDTLLKLGFTFGSGTRWSSATLASGTAFISNMNMSAITFNDYNKAATSTYVKSINLSTSASYSFSNGGFDNFDYKNTEGLTTSAPAGQLGTEVGVPLNWSLNDSTYAPLGDNEEDTTVYYDKDYIDDNNLVAGIIKMDADPNNGLKFVKSAQINALFGSAYDSAFGNLYGDANAEGYLNNYERIGGPSMLALAGLNGKKYYRAFTSDSFSLSSGKNYVIDVWVKTLDAATFGIYLTGETSGIVYFGQSANYVVKTTGAQDWTKYSFFVEVGLNSVSLKLKLSIGYDKVISGDLGAAADEFSSGVVLFDNVTMSSKVKSEEFDAIENSASATDKYSEQIVAGTGRKLSFLSDGFDLSSSQTGRDKLNTPNSWSGSVGTDQESKNTLSGIVYADPTTLPTTNVDSADATDDLYKDLVASYVSLFGGVFKLADYEILQTDIEAARVTYPGKTDSEIETILKKLRYYDEMKQKCISVENLVAMDNSVKDILGKSFLVINNIKDSAYTYTSTSYTFSAESCYRVSVWVRTYNVTGSGASVQLYLGSANESDHQLVFKGIKGTEGNSDWTKYTFYVKTLEESVSSITVKLALGEYDADDKAKLSSGYAMFDAVEIEIIDEADFTTIETESNKEEPDTAIFNRDVMMIHTVPESSTTGETGEEPTEEPTETPNNAFNLDYLWWMIPTILLAIATIAVVVAYFVKKIKKPKKAVEIEMAKTSEAIDEKRSRYEDYNE